MSKQRKQKPTKTTANTGFKFRSDFNLGSLEAESDQYLNEVFVDRSELNILINTLSPGCVTIGRTGSGKTALLKHIAGDPTIRVTQIVPEEMSLQYLSNSTILNYFESLNIRLDLFYKTLWKHVFVVELLKMYCRDDEKFENILSNMIERITGRDSAKKKAVEYLTKWKDSFWHNAEYRIKEMESLVEKNFAAKLNLTSPSSFKDFIGLSAGFSDDKKESNKVKTEVIQKAQSVVNEMQMQDITEVIHAMKTHLFTTKKDKFVIIIDDLDKEWIDKKNVYSLIKAMLDAIKDLKDIEGTKIVIALRENLFRLVLNNSTARGVQREKYESLLVKIRWTRVELEDLINNRLAQMMKNKYTNQAPTIHNILKWQGQDRKSIAFEYMLERTLMRPRDIIAFFNICIRNANGLSEINSEIIKNSETEYSKDRLKAIIDEWSENYEHLNSFLKVLRGSKENFTLIDIKAESEAFISSPICTFLNPEVLPEGDFKNTVSKYNETLDITPLLTLLMVYMYNVGVVGIKLSPSTPYEFSFDSNSIIEYTDISIDTKLSVHKTFHKALNIIPTGR